MLMVPGLDARGAWRRGDDEVCNDNDNDNNNNNNNNDNNTY